MKAFPHPDYMKTNDDVVTRIKYLEQGMDLRDYFAAKSPEIPSWFERKKIIKKEVVRSVEDNLYRQHEYTELEPIEEYFFRWRYYYADKMMEARK